jgi:hypothetical protein
MRQSSLKVGLSIPDRLLNFCACAEMEGYADACLVPITLFLPLTPNFALQILQFLE